MVVRISWYMVGKNTKMYHTEKVNYRPLSLLYSMMMEMKINSWGILRDLFSI